MAVFLGHQGGVRLRRASRSPYGLLQITIAPDDVNTLLNRLSFNEALDNLLTGDKIDLITNDSRGLAFLPASFWEDINIEKTATFHVNVNVAGGVRFFKEFEDAVNNNREKEIKLQNLAGDPLAIELALRDVSYNVLGNVESYTLNTEREALDITSLNDKFRKQYAAGLITGGGTVDCLFDYTTTGIKETPLLLLQLIHRIDIGSEFDLALFLTDKTNNPSNTTVFYEMSAMVTRAGVEVRDNAVVSCAIDFVTTNEIRLLVGEPIGYVLKEDDDRIQTEQTLGFLLKEIDD